MRNVVRWVVLASVVSAGHVGCGGAAANQPAGSMSAGPMPAGGDWSGVYYSDWGRLEMQRTGDTVVGEFRSDTKTGRISGTANGNLLTFQFTQNDETIPARPRTFQGAGQFKYYIDDNGDHKLQGSWGFGAEVDDGGPWNATRSRRAAFQFLTTGGARRSHGPDTVGAEGGEGTGETAQPEPPPVEETDDLGDL